MRNVSNAVPFLCGQHHVASQSQKTRGRGPELQFYVGPFVTSLSIGSTVRLEIPNEELKQANI